MKFQLKQCPSCGKRSLKLVRTDYVLRAGGKELFVPKLERYECASCDEVLFDEEGGRRIDEARAALRPARLKRKQAA